MHSEAVLPAQPRRMSVCDQAALAIPNPCFVFQQLIWLSNMKGKKVQISCRLRFGLIFFSLLPNKSNENIQGILATEPELTG